MQEQSEWILHIGNKDFYLTEEQHEVFLKAKGEGVKMVLFDNFEINPAFVEYGYRQRKNKTGSICTLCGGSGIAIKTIVGNMAETQPCKECAGNGRI